MTATRRTFAIGDIHGDLDALEALIAALPPLLPDDTVVFLGDYLDRGVRSRQVIQRVRSLQIEWPCKMVALRGNHEDLWIKCFDTPNLSFMLPRANGCGETFRSFVGEVPLLPDATLSPDEIPAFLDVKSWLPREVVEWMDTLALWYEDEHAIYVHAGLDGRGDAWKHPRDGRERPLMWMRDADFYGRYKGKRVVFGHTPVRDLPVAPDLTSAFENPRGVWVRGDLVGIDTACGKGGFLSAVEFPAMRVYDSRG